MKAVGSITSALIGRTRPMGIARAGSREDRLQAYRVFLDALVRWESDHAMVHIDLQAGRPANYRELMEESKDILSAIYALRMSAPVQVLDAAERVTQSVPAPDLAPEEFEAQAGVYKTLLDEFLLACRRDMNFNYRRWQVWRWHKLWAQRRYLKESASGGDTAELPEVSGAVVPGARGEVAG